MFSDRNYLLLLILSLMIAAVSCGDITDDLFPSSKDKRPSVEAGTIGPAVGQNAPDFTVPDTNGDIVTLASAIADRKGAVFYFTMWCPICDSHMSHMMNATVPLYPDVRFFAVDYVSATIADAWIMSRRPLPMPGTRRSRTGTRPFGYWPTSIMS